VVVLDGAGGASVLEGGAEPVDAIDPTRRYGRADAAGEPLEGDVQGALDRAAAVVAAELVGVCQRALDMTLANVKDRKQFGVPVGSFQAVQHRCAQMLLDTEGARSTAYFAAWAADAAPERLAEAAGLARAAAGEAGRAVTAGAIQAHGGIGFTWEADVHWLFKRAQLDAALLGSATAARIGLARLVASQRGVTA
jgi:alkylation response protein AidB-like acyl-CoA dehydrogenase